MRIKLKLKYRPKHLLAPGHRSSTSRARGTPRVSDRTRQVDPASVSHVYEEREISGVNAMNHFLDLPRQLPEPVGNTSLPVKVISEHVEKAIQLDQIAVEEVQVLPGSRIVTHSDPRGAGADRFRFLRMCLRELWHAGKLKSLQITSPFPQEGKSTIALNL